MALTHGSLFSGVGGFDIGADAAGIETLWQCEIDSKPRSVLKKHWPDATQYTDVNDVKGDEVKPVDIISFGSPCQDLSVAGKRAGLAGARSGLFHQAIRIIKEMRDATQNQYPRIAIWENVRGALSSNDGADFHEALQALAAIGAVDISYRVVNACNFGVPQRRVRVFVVADFGGECAGEILAQSPRLLWHPGSSNQEKQEATRETKESPRISSQPSESILHSPAISPALVASLAKMTGNTQDDTIVAYTKGKRASSPDDYETWDTDRPSPTLNLMDNTGESRATVLAVAEPGADQYRVRRLTPRECERLMGWPDDHTRYDSEGNELSDTARYKMCGNGIASPVAQWLCENIVKHWSK